MLHLGLESGSRFLQAVGFVHESWHRWKTDMDANPWQIKATKLFSLCGVSVITSWQCNYLIAMNWKPMAKTSFTRRVHLQQRLSQKRYCLKFLSSKFDFEEQSAAIWRQLVETHLTAASLSSLQACLPFCLFVKFRLRNIHNQFNKVMTDPVVFTWRLWDEGFRLLQNTRQTVVLDCISYGQKQNHQTNK